MRLVDWLNLAVIIFWCVRYWLARNEIERLRRRIDHLDREALRHRADYRALERSLEERTRAIADVLAP